MLRPRGGERDDRGQQPKVHDARAEHEIQTDADAALDRPDRGEEHLEAARRQGQDRRPRGVLGHLRRAAQAPQRRQRPLLQQEAHPERQRDEQEQVHGRHAAVREPAVVPPCHAGPRPFHARRARRGAALVVQARGVRAHVVPEPVEARVFGQVVLGLLRQRHARLLAPPELRVRLRADRLVEDRVRVERGAAAALDGKNDSERAEQADEPQAPRRWWWWLLLLLGARRRRSRRLRRGARRRAHGPAFFVTPRACL